MVRYVVLALVVGRGALNWSYSVGGVKDDPGRD